MTVHCKRCGRELTNPKSVERGYGPVCWRRIHTRNEGVANLDKYFENYARKVEVSETETEIKIDERYRLPLIRRTLLKKRRQRMPELPASTPLSYFMHHHRPEELQK